jgi:tetratricopeptide (TPR) repeat protein
MAETTVSALPKPTPEQRRAAATQFDKANQVLSQAGCDYDYALQLLMNCCQADPRNAIYRQGLHKAQRARYQENGKGHSLAPVLTLWARWKLAYAMMRNRYADALMHAESILLRNPWDISAHVRIAQIFERVGLIDLAIWTLEQVRPSRPNLVRINRPLAQLYERRGNFTQAIALWQKVKIACPTDLEAQHKAKDLAASATIAKGRYEQAVHGEAPMPLVTSSSREHQALADGKAEAKTATAEGPPSSSEDRVTREAASVLAKIKANPTNANNYLQLAGIFRRLDQFDKAREVLTEGLGPTGNSFEIAQELLDLEIEPMRRDLAVTIEELRKQPKNVELQQSRKALDKEINARELDYYRRRSDRYPTEVSSRYEMSLRLMRVGQLDEAIRELQAIRTDPRHHGKALFYLGYCFQLRKNWRLAQRNFEEALKQLANDDAELRKEAMYYLATGSAEAGDLNKAIDFGCELANLDYSYKDISTRLEKWQAKATR